MCRLAGLAVVDRLKSEIITAGITHYQHIALLQARRHILKRVMNRHKMKHPDEPKVHTPSSSTPVTSQQQFAAHF